MNRCALIALPIAVLWLCSAPAAPARDFKKVEELIDVMRLEESVTTAVAQMLLKLFASSPEFDVHQDILVDYTEEHVGWKVIKPEIVRLYAEAFTDAEILELIRFYSSAVGKKALDVAPQMTERMQALIETRFNSELDILELRMKNREWEMFVAEEAFADPDTTQRKGTK